MERCILHIDFDSFFASCEQQFHPQFRDKPLGVTAHNGRTAIIAASREAKKQGVKSPSRTFEAQMICPELILTPAHFEKYWEISKQFLNICKDYSPFIELFSLDEVFMDVTRTAHLFNGVEGIITQIKSRIRKELGAYITVSVGVSHNKLLAKLGSGLQKPNGITYITPQNLASVYKQAKLTDICGIGERIAIRLYKIGVFTLPQLALVPFYRLVAEFGKIKAQFLYAVGLGKDDTPVIPYTELVEVKSVGRNYCLPRNEHNSRIVLQNVCELCEEVAIKLRRLGKKARTVGVSLRGNLELGGRKTYHNFLDKGQDLFYSCLEIIKRENGSITQFFESGGYIRQISIWVSNLEDARTIPLSLFDTQARFDTLTRVIDAINNKFGDHTIRNGFLLYADKLTTEPNGYMADRFERIKLANESYL